LPPREARWLVRSGKISSSVDIGKHVTPFDNFVGCSHRSLLLLFPKTVSSKSRIRSGRSLHLHDSSLWMVFGLVLIAPDCSLSPRVILPTRDANEKFGETGLVNFSRSPREVAISCFASMLPMGMAVLNRFFNRLSPAALVIDTLYNAGLFFT
jgi:hypothetical protein